jgi:hypothetical protein
MPNPESNVRRFPAPFEERVDAIPLDEPPARSASLSSGEVRRFPDDFQQIVEAVPLA